MRQGWRDGGAKIAKIELSTPTRAGGQFQFKKTVAMEEAEAKALKDTLASLPEMLRKRQKALDEREKALEENIEAFEKEKEIFGASSSKGNQNDVLHLNVGGTVVNVSRKTLTQVEGSMLASLFSGRWDDNIDKDRDGNFFIDQPADLFLPLIDYFRDKLCETPECSAVESPEMSDFGNNAEKKHSAFLRMVEHYGLTPGVYPCVITVHSGLLDKLPDYTISKPCREGP
jgi:hypothetical protein